MARLSTMPYPANFDASDLIFWYFGCSRRENVSAKDEDRHTFLPARKITLTIGYLPLSFSCLHRLNLLMGPSRKGVMALLSLSSHPFILCHPISRRVGVIVTAGSPSPFARSLRRSSDPPACARPPSSWLRRSLLHPILYLCRPWCSKLACPRTASSLP